MKLSIDAIEKKKRKLRNHHTNKLNHTYAHIYSQSQNNNRFFRLFSHFIFFSLSPFISNDTNLINESHDQIIDR